MEFLVDLEKENSPNITLAEQTQSKQTASKHNIAKQRDADAHNPRRTALQFYALQIRKNTKEQNPSLISADITKLIAVNWKNLTGSEKTTFETQARQDKLRFDEESKIYAASKSKLA